MRSSSDRRTGRGQGTAFATSRPIRRERRHAAAAGLAPDMRPIAVPLAEGLATLQPPEPLRLGTLEIHVAARIVTLDGVPVDLGGRGFDLLMGLVEARGQVVSKQALLGRVWPNVTVVDSNLKVQLSLLRRALGAERWRVKTISGRGYLLVLDDAPMVASPQVVPPAESATPRPLVIVVDADRGTQEVLVRLLAEVAKCFDASSRLAFVTG